MFPRIFINAHVIKRVSNSYLSKTSMPNNDGHVDSIRNILFTRTYSLNHCTVRYYESFFY